MAWVRAAAVADVPNHSNRAVDVAGRRILICRAPMGLFAVGSICSHQQQDLEGGKMKGCFLFCPLHGVRFDLRDGSPAGTLTDRPIATYPARIDGDSIFVDLAFG